MIASVLPIPPRIHFIWIAPPFGALPYLAVRAALDRAGAEEVVLHVESEQLEQDPLILDLLDRPGFSVRRLDAETLFDRTRPALRHLYERLTHPPSRANLARLVILDREGGIYLDTDAIALRDLTPLRAEEGFGGMERIVFSAAVHSSRNPLRWLHAGLLTATRDLVRRAFLDAGSAFRRIERLYPLAANNAVLGARPGHPLLDRVLDRVSVMDEEYAMRRYHLGPKLLEMVTDNRSREGFRLFEPWAFYALPPEICAAYVHPDPSIRLGDRPHPDAFVAHVYDSVLRLRLKRPLNADYFAETRGQTLLARMIEPYLDDLLALS